MPRKFTAKTKVRFLRERAKELVRHLGRQPSVPELILIRRAASLQWELQRMDQVELELLSGHALRARLAAENRLRLDLRELGMEPASGSAKTVWDVLDGRKAAAPKAGTRITVQPVAVQAASAGVQGAD